MQIKINIQIKIKMKIYIWGGGVRGPTLVLFLFYVNVSGMQPQSLLSSQPLLKPAIWVLLRAR